jgi:hypothetical protein
MNRNARIQKSKRKSEEEAEALDAMLRLQTGRHPALATKLKRNHQPLTPFGRRFSLGQLALLDWLLLVSLPSLPHIIAAFPAPHILIRLHPFPPVVFTLASRGFRCSLPPMIPLPQPNFGSLFLSTMVRRTVRSPSNVNTFQW